MPVPHRSESFGDLLDPDFQKIFHNQFEALPDMIPQLFGSPTDNGRSTMTWSEVGTLAEWDQFTNTVNYQSQTQGYDVTMTHVEFASGVQIERTLFDDDQYNIMNQRPADLATSAQRTRQTHAARVFNNAFSVDNFFSNHSEGVAMCSDSHTTNTSASTATGFDNLTTSALSATAVSAARIQMVGFRGDQAERMVVVPDEIIIPPNLFEEAWEINASRGKVDTANNNRNVHEGAYDIIEWNYLSDANNWFLNDSTMRKNHLHWVDRVPVEFAFAEDLDTIIAKWRGYMRYANAYTNWRWTLGGQVS